MQNKNATNVILSTVAPLVSNPSATEGQISPAAVAICQRKYNSRQKHNGVRPEYNLRRSSLATAVRSALIGFGIGSMTLSHSALAESHIVAQAPEVTYSIPAGSLEDALHRFAQQTGTTISFVAADVKDVTTQGLNGKFSVQDGLERLLAGSNLQAVPQADGYIVKKSVSSDSGAPAGISAILPEVVVTATTVSDATTYAAPRSITATKTNTLLRDVPQQVTVMTQALMQDQSIRSMADAVRYVPGVGVSTGEGNRDALVFRGNRSTGDFFVDGIRDDVEYFRDWYNIERIEVLKGPNGMIFGRGGSGGVINRVTKQAGWDPIREFTFQAGSYGQKRVTTDLNHAINDMAALRFNGLFENSDSYRDGVEIRRYGISPSFTIKPGANTRVAVNMELFKDERIADRGVPSFQGRPFNTHASTFFGDPRRSPTDTNAKSIAMLVEHKFNDRFTLRNRTRYAIYDKFYQNVFAGGPVSGGLVPISAYNNQQDRENFFNQTDLLFSFDTGWFKHELVTGVEVGRQISDTLRRTGLNPGGGTQIDLVSVNNPITAAPIAFINRGTADANFHTSTSVAAVYIQDQIKILPQLHAILGVRYDRFEVDFHRKDGLGATPNLQTRDDLISPRFGLVYKPIEPVSIYGSYSLAYVPRAGDQLTSINVTNQALDPERFINIEGGIKWDIRPNLAFTTAFYQLDRTNVIFQDPNIAARTFLGKGQRVRGVEAGISGRITSAWSVMGGYAYQEGVLRGNQDNSGNTVAELPRHSFSLWNRYDFTPMWGAAFGVIGRSNMFAAVDNAVVLPDFVRVDAALYGKLTKNIRAQVNIENLFDVNYIAAAHNNNNILPGSPIAARAMIIANF